MSIDTRELIETCEQLPEAKQVEVADFARFLLAQQGKAEKPALVEGWLKQAPGSAKTGMTTDKIMRMTRADE